MASRTQLAVLEPTPKSALNVPRASSLSLKRRKTSHHDYIETKSVSTPLFTIRVCTYPWHCNALAVMNSLTSHPHTRPMPLRRTLPTTIGWLKSPFSHGLDCLCHGWTRARVHPVGYSLAGFLLPIFQRLNRIPNAAMNRPYWQHD